MRERVGRVLSDHREMRRYMTQREAFCSPLRKIMDSGRGRSVFATPPGWNNIVNYTVHSYGTHYPMYVWDSDTQKWYGNNEKYSRTTTKWMSKLQPDGPIEWVSMDKLMVIRRVGVVGLIRERLALST